MQTLQKVRGPRPRAAHVRFWPKVVEHGDCWIWEGYVDKLGYGRFGFHSIAPEKMFVGLAHRWAYEWMFSESPKELDHLCDNRACVNPFHLEAVTHSENVRRSYQRRKERG